MILCIEATPVFPNGKLGNTHVSKLTEFADLQDLLFDGAQVDDVYQLKLVELTDEAFADLDDFEGF